MIVRVAHWVGLQVDTYKVAKAEGMSYWELRRLRKLAKQFVQLMKDAEARDE